MSFYEYSMPDGLQQRLEALDPYPAAVVAQQIDEGYLNDLPSLLAAVEQAESGAYASGYGDELPTLHLSPGERAQHIVYAATNKMAKMDEGGRYGRTRYEDRDTIADRAAYPEDGRVFGADGQPMNGRYAWVIDDATGYLLFLPENAVVVHEADGRTMTMSREDWVADLPALKARGATYEKIHHTTPVAGMPVTGAGIMELQDGWIVTVTDESGHYQPTAENQYQAMQALEDSGFSLEQPVSAEDSPDGVEGYRGATVRLTGSDGGGRPTSKAEWLDQMKAENPYLSTDELELRWEQFEQTQGNEAQARLKDATQREMMARFAAQAAAPVPAEELQDSGRFVFDEARDLYRDELTYHHYDRQGELVYAYDPQTGKYLTRDGEPVGD
jgi:hypothetical protein